jgi:hypothetical protein
MPTNSAVVAVNMEPSRKPTFQLSALSGSAENLMTSTLPSPCAAIVSSTQHPPVFEFEQVEPSQHAEGTRG